VHDLIGLYGTDIGLLLPNATVYHLLQNQLDHCPFIIDPNGYAPLEDIQRPFGFQATWLSHDKFKEYLYEHWNAHTSLYPLLQHLSDALKEWNRRIFWKSF